MRILIGGSCLLGSFFEEEDIVWRMLFGGSCLRILFLGGGSCYEDLFMRILLCRIFLEDLVWRIFF